MGIAGISVWQLLIVLLIVIMLFAPNGILSLNWRGMLHKVMNRPEKNQPVGEES